MPTGAPVKMAAPAQLQADQAWAADETERFIIYIADCQGASFLAPVGRCMITSNVGTVSVPVEATLY